MALSLTLNNQLACNYSHMPHTSDQQFPSHKISEPQYQNWMVKHHITDEIVRNTVLRVYAIVKARGGIEIKEGKYKISFICEKVASPFDNALDKIPFVKTVRSWLDKLSYPLQTLDSEEEVLNYIEENYVRYNLGIQAAKNTTPTFLYDELADKNAPNTLVPEKFKNGTPLPQFVPGIYSLDPVSVKSYAEGFPHVLTALDDRGDTTRIKETIANFNREDDLFYSYTRQVDNGPAYLIHLFNGNVFIPSKKFAIGINHSTTTLNIGKLLDPSKERMAYLLHFITYLLNNDDKIKRLETDLQLKEERLSFAGMVRVTPTTKTYEIKTIRYYEDLKQQNAAYAFIRYELRVRDGEVFLSTFNIE